MSEESEERAPEEPTEESVADAAGIFVKASRLSTAERRMIKYFRIRPDRAAEMLLKIDLLPFQRIQILMAWYFPWTLFILTRGAGKTFTLAVISLLWAMLYQRQKIGLIAASYRQAKMIFAEIDRIYYNAPILQAMSVKAPVRGTDMCYFHLLTRSEITALPLGDGEKIRGARFYRVVADELAQIPDMVLNVVVFGMMATRQDPVKQARLAKVRKKLGVDENVPSAANYFIGASTAYYQFNHLYRRMMESIDIINNKRVVEGKAIWENYSLCKLSYDMLPDGFLSIESILMSKQQMSSMQFDMEYNARFPTESGGFFPARIVVNAVSVDVDIHIELNGDPRFPYVLFIDPARTSDNCTFAIAKLLGTGTRARYAAVRVVAIRGKKFQIAAALIWSLCRQYNIVRIGMDSRGGGLTIKDLLNDKAFCPEGSDLIWDYEDPASYVDGDQRRHPRGGRHILHMVDFNPRWISDANHGLLASFESQEFVWPLPLGIEDLTGKSDAEAEELEAAEVEIQETKSEIITIVMTPSGRGTPHWDTLTSGQRKDRYSAILGLCQECKEYMKGSDIRNVEVELPTGGWAATLSHENIGLEAADLSTATVAHRRDDEKDKRRTGSSEDPAAL
jgi:hypothetical protein